VPPLLSVHVKSPLIVSTVNDADNPLGTAGVVAIFLLKGNPIPIPIAIS